MIKQPMRGIADVKDIRDSLKSLFMMIVLGAMLYCIQPVILAHGLESVAHNRITSFLLESFSDNHLPVALTTKEKKALHAFYRQRYFSPLWVSGWGVKPNVFKAINVIENAQDEGLNPEHYPLRNIKTLLSNKTPKGLADLEILLSYTILRYSSDVHHGRFNPEHLLVSVSVLDDTAKAKPKDVKRVLGSYRPVQKEYQILKRLLRDYKALEAQGGWPTIPHYMKLQKGDKEKEIKTLRKALVITGDLGNDSENAMFNDELEVAVKRFQMRHGIEVDGVVGRYTRDALNTPLSKRIDQIIVNIERLRWLPKTRGKQHIIVNIPAFRLHAVNGGDQALSMRVIVGRPSRETPLFSREVSHVVFSPPWGVPPRIAGQDLLPKIQNQPQFLDFAGFQLYNYQKGKAVRVNPNTIDWSAMNPERFKHYSLRQKPGSRNPLGQVKFLIPDSSFVYIHDTPDKHLFGRSERAFSSGCIRVESPKALANFVLGTQKEWNTARVYKAFDTQEKTKYVKVSEPPKVHVVYWTVWVDENGDTHFANDIYRKDASLITAMHSPKYSDSLQLVTQ